MAGLLMLINFTIFERKMEKVTWEMTGLFRSDYFEV